MWENEERKKNLPFFSSNWTVGLANWIFWRVQNETLRITWVSLIVMGLAERHVSQGQDHSWEFDYKSNLADLEPSIVASFFVSI